MSVANGEDIFLIAYDSSNLTVFAVSGSSPIRAAATKKKNRSLPCIQIKDYFFAFQIKIKSFIIIYSLYNAETCNEFVEPISTSLSLHATQLDSKKRRSGPRFARSEV